MPEFSDRSFGIRALSWKNAPSAFGSPLADHVLGAARVGAKVPLRRLRDCFIAENAEP